MEKEKNFFDRVKSAWPFGKKEAPKQETTTQPKQIWGTGTYNHIGTFSYTGEKNLGEAGPIRKYQMEYQALRLRSWQAYIESEVAQTLIRRHCVWVIGKGLKLCSEPAKKVLEIFGIKNFDSQKFSQSVEALFNLFRKTRCADHSRMKSLNRIAKRIYQEAIVGGDVLVVLRYERNYVTTQAIDGALVQSPLYGSETYPQQLANGNQIINGVELDPTGRHVAYHVRNGLKFERYEALGSTGLVQAFLVYGLEYRLENVRGIPLIGAIIETLKKLERYKEATLGTAEERAKITATVEHGVNSTGLNPLQERMMVAVKEAAGEDIPTTDDGTEVANKIAATTNKMVWNMPKDSTLKFHENKGEINFKDFYTVNIHLVAAAIGIPPEVAMMLYESNFSSSRAAIKDWEHTLGVAREEFAEQFYQIVYNFWLEVEVLKGTVQAPGYLAKEGEEPNEMVIEAYRSSRFIGPPVPHIDPLKEINAIRGKLGISGDSLPLTTLEQATEEMGGGDSQEIVEQFSQEIERAKELGIIEEIVEPDPQKKLQKQVEQLFKLMQSMEDKITSIRTVSEN